MKVKRIIISIFIVFIANILFLFSYAFITEKENTDSIKEGELLNILTNDNPLTKLSDYDVSNWDSEISSEEKDNVLLIIENADCKKTNRVVACLVQLLQNSYNSISEIEMIEFDGVKKEYANNVSDWFLKTRDSVISCEVVKLFGDYFLICDYINDVNDIDNFFATSVYKVENPEDICGIDEFKKTNENYSRTYPDKISFFSSSPIWIVLLVVIFMSEIFLLFKVLKIVDKTK